MLVGGSVHNPTYESVRPSDRRLTRESLRIAASLGFAEFGLTNLARQDRETSEADVARDVPGH